MMNLDSFTLVIVILCSSFGSLFTLFIPLYDQNSKRIISLFFSVVALVFYGRLLMMYLGHQDFPDIVIKFPLGETKMMFRVLIDDFNILIFGVISLFLVMSFLFVFDMSRHVSYFSTFLLSLFLFICIGQINIRISLPLISISSFVIYYLISQHGKERRGTTIFRMGVFLFSVECCALILLQHREFATMSSTHNIVYSFMLILPGLARLLLPVCAPFAEFLLGNFDDRHVDLTLIYLQISGFFLIRSAKSELTYLSEEVLIFLNSATIISLFLVIVFLAYRRSKKHNLYYSLIFFSGLSAIGFLTLKEQGEKIAIALFITNLVSYIVLSTLSSYIEYLAKYKKYSESSKAATFVVINVLIVGLPGVGVGASLAYLIYFVLDPNAVAHLKTNMVWLLIFASYLVVLGIWMSALLGSFGWHDFLVDQQESRTMQWRSIKMPRASVYLAAIFIMAFSLIAPYIIALRT